MILVNMKCTDNPHNIAEIKIELSLKIEDIVQSNECYYYLSSFVSRTIGNIFGEEG